MKKKILISLFIIATLGVFIFSINRSSLFAEDGGYSCTVSKDCFSPSCGNSTISCSGTIKCKVKPTYVECDNKKTYCCGYGNDN